MVIDTKAPMELSGNLGMVDGYEWKRKPRNMDFDLWPDNKGLFLDVKYPHEDKPRYSIDLLEWTCTCEGHTVEQGRAANEGRKPKNCKHLEEVVFRLRHAGIKLGRFLVKEAIE